MASSHGGVDFESILCPSSSHSIQCSTGKLSGSCRVILTSPHLMQVRNVLFRSGRTGSAHLCFAMRTAIFQAHDLQGRPYDLIQMAGATAQLLAVVVRIFLGIL